MRLMIFQTLLHKIVHQSPLKIQVVLRVLCKPVKIMLKQIKYLQPSQLKTSNILNKLYQVVNSTRHYTTIRISKTKVINNSNL